MASKYVWTDDMREISGFGGGYEATCRAMVVAGLEWFDALPKDTAEPTFKQFKNIVGVISASNPNAKAMQAAMLKAPGADGCTGAMMQFSVHHVMKALELGWSAYVEKMRELKRAEDHAAAGKART